VSQVVCFLYIIGVPSRQPHAYQFASKYIGIQNVQQYEGSYTVLLYINLYTIICTHSEVLNDINNAQMLYLVVV
jgi:hypothetical protein